MKRFTTFLLNDLLSQQTRYRIALLSSIGLLAGFFFSRAVLSISFMALFVNAIHPDQIRVAYKQWKQNYFLLFSLAYFLLYFLSVLWSHDKHTWLVEVIKKLPFAIMPFAMLSLPIKQKKYLLLVIGFLFLFDIIIIGRGLVALYFHYDEYLHGYSVSKVLPTTKYNDHIRFSLTLVFSLYLALFLILEKKQWLRKTYIYLLVAFCLLLFTYIHILAVKSGVIALYLSMPIFVALRFWKRNKGLVLALIIGICIVPLVAFYTLPTFKNKVYYIKWEIDRISKHNEELASHYSDDGRLITYAVGYEVLKQSSLLGVGAGDMNTEINKGYARKFPEVPQANRWVPINQFFCSSLAIGIPLMLMSLLPMMLIPLFNKKNKWYVYGATTCIIFLFASNVESMFENQLGVFVYLFFTLFWYYLDKDTTQDNII
ncbi:MAG: O-antigen ligase family protein [Chitinophagaceae bacterium]